MGALEPAALLRSPRPDFTDPADLERYLSTVRKEDLPAVLASLCAQADQAEAACWEQINWGLAKLAELWTARSRGPDDQRQPRPGPLPACLPAAGVPGGGVCGLLPRHGSYRTRFSTHTLNGYWPCSRIRGHN